MAYINDEETTPSLQSIPQGMYCEDEFPKEEEYAD